MQPLNGYQSLPTQPPPSTSFTSPRPPSTSLRLSTPPQHNDSHHPSHLMSSTQATISIVKGIAGAGIFALPYAFAQSGLLSGIVATLLLAFLSSYSITLLVTVKRHAFGSAAVTYLDVAQRILGDEAARLASVAVVACSMGVSTAYLDFIRCMCKSLWPSIGAAYGSGVFLIPVLPVIIALCLLRSYRLLALTALIGDVSIFLGALCVVSYGLSSFSSATSSLPSTAADFSASDYLLKPSTFPVFLSTAAFLFCVHFFILPIEANLQHPTHFTRSVRHSFLLTALFNAAFGSIGLLCFRSPSPVVLDNIEGGMWVWSVKLLLCIDMIFSYAVVFFPGRELIENAVLGRDSPPSSPEGSRGAVVSETSLLRQESEEQMEEEEGDSVVPVSAVTLHSTPFPSSHHVTVVASTSSTSNSSPASPSSHRPALRHSFSSPSFPSSHSFSFLSSLSPDTLRNLVRTALVLFTVLLALCVPMFSVVISLVGGLSMTSLGFVFPPLMALRLVRNGSTKRLAGSSRSAGSGGEEEEEGALEGGWRGVSVYVGLIVFGVVIMLLTVVTSARHIVAALQLDAPLESC